jgi:maleate isomerase
MQDFYQKNYPANFLKFTVPRIGLIALSCDYIIEKDFLRICHDQKVNIYVNRIPYKNPLTGENLFNMKKHLHSIAEDILPGEKIDIIVYGCTSGSIVIGEDTIIKEIQKSKPDSYVTTPTISAIKAFKKFSIKKISVLTPYTNEVNKKIFDYLISHDFEIISFNSYNLELANETASVDPQSIFETIKKIDYEAADCIFICCTNLPALEVLDQMEKEIKKTIISSNQALIWECLRAINIENAIRGYGKLLMEKI